MGSDPLSSATTVRRPVHEHALDAAWCRAYRDGMDAEHERLLARIVELEAATAAARDELIAEEQRLAEAIEADRADAPLSNAEREELHTERRRAYGLAVIVGGSLFLVGMALIAARACS